jgi:ketosteroid isomerase-like protein
MTTLERDKQALAALVEEYRIGWKTMDVERLKSIWDRDYDNFIYIALELARPVRDWNGIEKYYERVAGLFETVTHMSIDDLSIEVLGDVAFAYCTFHFESKFKGQSEAHTADARITFIFHRRNEVWKVIHYHESRPGPLSSPY